MKIRNGSYKWKEGHSYDGKWQKDVMEGEGKFIWSDKEIYEGTFSKNDLKADHSQISNV